jgi:TolB-like protein/DNA-binding winged helix-turn-helix (wHTH) protein/Tfp pilus assembly protein PilF
MTDPSQSGSWQVGDWVADPSDDSLSRQGVATKIEPRLMQLLICLAESAPQVVSIERLLTEVWSGVIVGPASVYQSVSQLRKILGDTDSPPRYIETVARKGYRLVAPAKRMVTDATAPVDAASRADARVRASRKKVAYAGAVAGVLLLLVGAIALWRINGDRPASDSIAVLPFVDLTANQSDAPFCDGLTEELSSWIGQLPSLNVVARTSASAFRDKREDVREIGRRLGATHVLEGSVRREGDALRVTVKLVATKSGYQIWTESYDTGSNGVIAVQERIARAVATNLEVRLTQDTLNRFDARRSTSEGAYRLYLIGRHHLRQLTHDDNGQAIALFRRVIDQDPKFALAYVGLARALINERYYVSRPMSAIAPEVEPLLAKAQQLQPALADLYAARGILETELFRFTAALRDLQRAVQLDANSRDALGDLAFLHLVSGEPHDALTSYTRAAQLDPIDGNMQAYRCMALQDLAQFDEAALACERARALDPRSAWAFSASYFLEDARGRLDEALRWNQAALALSPDSVENLAQRGFLLLSAGLPERAAETYRQATASLPPGAAANTSFLEFELLLVYATDGVSGLIRQLDATTLDATTSPETVLTMAKAALLANDARRAQELVDRALADPSLDPSTLNSPWLARTGQSHQLTAALARQLTGDPSGAEEHLAQLSALLDRLSAAGVQRYGVELLRAQVAALRGKADDAMRSLQAARNLGWPDVWRAEHEPYLASLRNRTDYRQLIDQVTQANARMQARIASELAGDAQSRPAARGN